MSLPCSSRWLTSFLIIFSIFFTSAVVYSIASSSIYTKEKELTFKKAIMTVVPKVWKHLMDTFLWSFIDDSIYNVVVVVLLVLTPSAVNPGTNAGTALLSLLLVPYLGGVVYINIVWQLALVIYVLEDFNGIEALTKSDALIKGMKVVYKIILNLVILFILIQHTVWV
ncbi:uncharacterized protein LOC122074385 [Macadamia integrifolia]|uniref:uncharacterized protein LOC122074385 n=1 Tax=Macadamia integrifolia TaxID=60698 RepID=UPI001C4EF17A|nr:uncharacterized protein LOC122074385 [Macadamia integrifolia]